MRRTHFAVAALFIALLIAAAPVAAQEEGQQDDPAAAEQMEAPGAIAPDEAGPLDIGPAGAVTPDWLAMRAIAASVPNPIAPAPILVSADANGYGVNVKLLIDGRRGLYSYRCGGQRCTGFATDLWRALGAERRQAYLDAILDRILDAAPGLHVYVVALSGSDQVGAVQATSMVNADGIRTYYAFPN